MRTQSMAAKKGTVGKMGKHNRTQSMTQRSRTSSFDVQPVHVTVTYNIKEDKIEQFLTALKPMVIATNKEKGCVRFNIHQDKGEKCKFIMMEEWKSQRYLTMHLKSEHLKKNIGNEQEIIMFIRVFLRCSFAVNWCLFDDGVCVFWCFVVYNAVILFF